jgi:epoxyqueuosine reductase
VGHLERTIGGAAAALGFDFCGFARVARPPHAEFVRRWITAGNGGEMAYLERGLAKRLDVRLVLPEARSVISLGMRYLPPPVPPIDWQGSLRGRIAAYAVGTDYHVRLERQLAALLMALRDCFGDMRARFYVDTGPILEREWAASAGVGWFGKNTNILRTEEGSWFFLAEMLTDLELEPGSPHPDHCGTCTRCLDRCPTGALRAPYELDARLCISYLTIEHRGVIPPALRPQLGNWIFGCDVCQEVCPWNERLGSPEARDSEIERLFPHLPELLALSDAEFRQRFRQTAIRRAKRDAFVRNVAVALGNTHNPAAAAPLTESLRHDPSALVRAHAAWALGAVGTTAACSGLKAALRCEKSPGVRDEIHAALCGAAS